jgi:hypothetical protein
MSRIRSVDPGLGVSAGLTSEETDEDNDAGRAPLGPSSEWEGGVNQ